MRLASGEDDASRDGGTNTVKKKKTQAPTKSKGELELEPVDVREARHAREVLDAAVHAHLRATKSRGEIETAIAAVTDAAWLADRRRRRGEERASAELLALRRAAEAYLATRAPDDSERWAFEALPRRKGVERTEALRELERRAREAKEHLLRPSQEPKPRPLVQSPHGFAHLDLVASALVAKARELGLAVDRVDRTDELAHKLGALRSRRTIAPSEIVLWTLKAAGVPSDDASDWTRAL
jgi:hypothetical protein